jgi:hypothetical protein
MRLADADSYTNRDGYSKLHAWLVCGCASPNPGRARSGRLFPG